MSKKKIQAMEAQLAVHEMLGQFRYIMIDGEIWFAAVDVAKILAIENIRQNLANFPEDEKKKFDILTAVCSEYSRKIFQATWFINEPGLYRLIFKSRKPEAEKFQDWVYHEVLPSIRKNGYYGFKKSDKVEENLKKAFSILADLDAKGIEWDFVFKDITLEYNEKLKEFRPCYNLKVEIK